MGGCLAKTDDTAGPKRWSITGTLRQSLDNFAMEHVPLAMTPGNFNDKYTIGDILGTGAYSTVFTATVISGGKVSGGSGGEVSGGGSSGEVSGGGDGDESGGRKPLSKGASKLFGPASPAAEKWDPEATADPDDITTTSTESVAVKRVEQKNMTIHHHAALRREVTIMADCAHPNVLSVSFGSGGSASTHLRNMQAAAYGPALGRRAHQPP